MKRREFGKLLGLAAVGLAVGDPLKAIASPGPYPFSTTGNGVTVFRRPTPINDGPAPAWEDFKYIQRVFKGHTSWTLGWHGWLQMPGEDRREYGDYITVSDTIGDDIVSEAKVLLREQANSVRHQLIIDARLPCFCTMCKANAIMRIDMKRVGRTIGASVDRPCNSPGAMAFIVNANGTGKGFYRAAYDKAEFGLSKNIMAMSGPTNGY